MKIRQKKSKVLFSAHIKKTLALSPYKVKKQIIFPCIYEELPCAALPRVAIGVITVFRRSRTFFRGRCR